MARRLGLKPVRAASRLEVDALGEPQPHQQRLVGLLGAAERDVFDDAVAARPRPAPAQRSGCAPCTWRGATAVDDHAAVGARPDARRTRRSASRAGCAGTPRPARRGWRSRRPAGPPLGQLLRQLVEGAAPPRRRARELAARVELGERRARLDGELVERQVPAGERQRLRQLARARPPSVWPGRA